MKYIMEHYGGAILVSLVFLALGGLVVYLLNTSGPVATEFRNALSSFFSSMNGLFNQGGDAAVGGAGGAIILPHM